MTLKLMFDGGADTFTGNLELLWTPVSTQCTPETYLNVKSAERKKTVLCLSHLFFLRTEEIILICMAITVLCLDSSEVKPSLLWVETNILTEV